MRFLLSLISILFSAGFLSAQKTPAELGTIVLQAYRTGGVQSLRQNVPDFDQLQEYTRERGLLMNDSELTRLKIAYPIRTNEFITKLEETRRDGIKRGIDWTVITSDSITTESQRVTMFAADETSSAMELVRLHIYLTSRRTRFELYFANLIEISGIWYLDDQVTLRELQEAE